MIRCYSELKCLATFESRYEYLKLTANVGEDTFGDARHINQYFYRSIEWRSVRREVVLRDEGLDLGCDGFLIGVAPIVHHMNPITIDDLVNFNPMILDPEYLITTSGPTHLAIHYGNIHLLPRLSNERRQGDTKLW